MAIGAPIMGIGAVIALVVGPLFEIMSDAGVATWIVSLFQDALITSISFAVLMCGFVFGTTLVFGILEESGYMARISFAFDNIMQKLGLHGKAIMPFMMSFGCNIAGSSGTRVLDSWTQKVKAIAVSWIIPCGSTWAIAAKEAVLGVLSALFNSEGIFAGVASAGMGADTTVISNGLLSAITKAEALAFMFAFFFNMPCMMAFTATIHELHSAKTTLKIAGYYVVVSLLLAFIAYHVGLIIF